MEGMFKVCFPLVMLYLDIDNEVAVLRPFFSGHTTSPALVCRVGSLIKSLFRQSSLLDSFKESHENSLGVVVPAGSPSNHGAFE